MKVLPYLWYPMFMTLGTAMFGVMLAANAPVAFALYIPIVLIALATLVLQARFPERSNWQPRASEITSDLTFIALVQVVLPQALAALALLAIASFAHDSFESSLWPHGLWLPAQVLLMLLIVDFLRYWVHRACHHYPALWQLHEVHHSPEILYSLNTARFHPLEKTLHFSVDTLPFIALGVAPEVIAGYFLVYALNGFFQHSNVRLRYGFLNRIVGSAETHRWHHARDPKTAACNFGSSTVVWDVAFGTWFLPEGRLVDELGILDRAYPKGFWQQMAAPFRGGRRGLKLAALLIKLHLMRVRWSENRRIAKAARDPMRAQNAVLRRIISDNKDTAFGREHRFAEIRGYVDYVERVPVGEYETLRPYIESQLARGETSLTMEQPVCYLRTSGTTGKPKDLPLTTSHLKALKRIQQAAVAFQHRACEEAFAGGILAITSPAREGKVANGKSYGSASGVVAASTPAIVRDQFVVPLEVLTIADSRIKYLLILRLALAREDMSWLGSANATTLLTLIKLYREHAGALIEDVASGGFFLANEVPVDVLSAVRSRLHANPSRAAQLRSLKTPRMVDLWPRLKLVVTWTCASAGIAVSALRQELSPRVRILELGYVSSEFRGTFTIGKRAGSGFPTLDTHFFEFVEREKWERGEVEYLTLDRIDKGIDYYIVVSTPSGLYRYFMNDLVRVTGFLRATPLLKFMQKGKGVTNITGEKLYESQVLTAVDASLDQRALPFMMMLADEGERRYRLYLELEDGCHGLAEAVDAKLTEINIEYRAKRESGRLGGLECVVLRRGAGEAYKKFCVQRGQREGQFKMMTLAYRREFEFDLDSFAK